MSDDRILEKIKKCLALAESSNPNEAAVAMRQAQKLMEMHGITTTDLKISDITSTKIRSTASVSKVKDWELNLVAVVATAFGCDVLWLRGNSYARRSENIYGHFELIGLKQQVPIAEYTASVLMRKLQKARAEFVSSLPDHYGRESKTVEADGFCQGWTARIAQTVHAFARSDELNSAIDAYRNKEFGEDIPDADVQNRFGGDSGYHHGVEAAEGESLHRPMGDKDKLKMIS